MNTQLDIFSQPPITGEMKRDIGISRAKNNAERQSPGWSETAYNFFINYAKNIGKPFMCNDVVLASEGKIPQPPNLKAWGGVSRKVIKSGLVVCIGFAKGSNPAHHCNPRNLYKWNKP